MVGIFWFMDHVGEGATRYQKFSWVPLLGEKKDYMLENKHGT